MYLTVLLAGVITASPVWKHTGEVDMIDDNHSVNNPKVVYVHGGITERTAKIFADDMQSAKNTGQSVIPVVISSYGGSVYALLEMIDTIKNIGLPVATIVTGKAMSAGAVLASCGTNGYRFASPNATYMVHEVSTGATGKIGEVEVDAEEGKRLNKLMLGIMSTNLGHAPDYFSKLIHEKGHADWYFTPNEASKHGLVNHVRIPTIKIRIHVEMDLE